MQVLFGGLPWRNRALSDGALQLLPMKPISRFQMLVHLLAARWRFLATPSTDDIFISFYIDFSC